MKKVLSLLLAVVVVLGLFPICVGAEEAPTDNCMAFNRFNALYIYRIMEGDYGYKCLSDFDDTLCDQLVIYTTLPKGRSALVLETTDGVWMINTNGWTKFDGTPISEMSERFEGFILKYDAKLGKAHIETGSDDRAQRSMKVTGFGVISWDAPDMSEDPTGYEDKALFKSFSAISRLKAPVNEATGRVENDYVQAYYQERSSMGFFPGGGGFVTTTNYRFTVQVALDRAKPVEKYSFSLYKTTGSTTECVGTLETGYAVYELDYAQSGVTDNSVDDGLLFYQAAAGCCLIGVAFYGAVPDEADYSISIYEDNTAILDKKALSTNE